MAKTTTAHFIMVDGFAVAEVKIKPILMEHEKKVMCRRICKEFDEHHGIGGSYIRLLNRPKVEVPKFPPQK